MPLARPAGIAGGGIHSMTLGKTVARGRSCTVQPAARAAKRTAPTTLATAAKVLAGVTVAVAAAGEAIAIANKLRDEGARPLQEYATAHYDQATDAPEDEQSYPSRYTALVLAPVHDAGDPVDHSHDTEVPMASRNAYLDDATACAMLNEARTPLRPRLRPFGYRIAKRAFDLGFSSAVVVLGALPAAAVCAAISLDSPGAPIYRQRRVARLRPDGTVRTFWMFKFRTMVDDAEDQLADLWDQNDADGPMFKIKQDPRITRIGALLRPHSLDELPQFLNVLTGDMSMVGPRPPLPNEVVTYDRHEWERMTVPQGLTGYWQTRGRSDTSWDENVQYDLEYVEEASSKVDLRCVLKTIAQMFTGRGAY